MDDNYNHPNNKLYWQNLSDGEHRYSLQLPAGNYSPESLAKNIEILFSQVPKINSNHRHLVKVLIDIDTNKVRFLSYSNINLISLIKNETELILFDDVNIQVFKNISIYDENIYYRLPKNPINDHKVSPNFNIKFGRFILTINHQNHDLNIGDQITILNAIEHAGIPSNIINQQYTILTIIDQNSYQIELKRFNLLDHRSLSGFGVETSILIPNLFRLLFDHHDTMADVLGFKKIKYIDQVPYSFEITNNKKNKILCTNNNYFHMICKQLNNIINIGNVLNVFAKIIIKDHKLMCDTFVPIESILEYPIKKLCSLNFEFKNQDGSDVNFSEIDHSFTIEFTSLNQKLIESEINTRN